MSTQRPKYSKRRYWLTYLAATAVFVVLINNIPTGLIPLGVLVYLWLTVVTNFYGVFSAQIHWDENHLDEELADLINKR